MISLEQLLLIEEALTKILGIVQVVKNEMGNKSLVQAANDSSSGHAPQGG